MFTDRINVYRSVREGGLEPPRLRIRPSNVRVYQFHHSRAPKVFNFELRVYRWII
jgi:hypothetical protein